MLLLVAATLLNTGNLLDFSIHHWRTEPETRVEDAYKWLYHATLGGEHAIINDAGPRRWMETEWSTLTPPRPREPESVPLRPDGRIVRVNLRPYKARGGDSEMLLAILVMSAQSFRASREDFVREWHALGARLQKSPVGKINHRDWVRLDREAKPLGYPAVHHSKEYEKAYRPSYRVVLGELWP